MTNSLATLALILVLAGSAVAQQKQPKRAATGKSSNGTISADDAARSNTSAANTHDGTNGVSTGTGLTNDQRQADAGSPNRGTTKVDASSSVRTGPSPVKARKKAVKTSN